jgi:hypothetical protein
MRGGVVSLRGRQYHVIIEISYTGGRLPNDAREALTSVMETVIGDGVSDLSSTVSRHPYSVLTVRATVRGTSPVDAVTRLDTSLNQSLLAIGIFEEFDVTGKVLRVAPLELAERIRHGVEE